MKFSIHLLFLIIWFIITPTIDAQKVVTVTQEISNSPNCSACQNDLLLAQETLQAVVEELQALLQQCPSDLNTCIADLKQIVITLTEVVGYFQDALRDCVGSACITAIQALIVAVANVTDAILLAISCGLNLDFICMVADIGEAIAAGLLALTDVVQIIIICKCN